VRETYSVHLATVTGTLIVLLAVLFALIQSPTLFETTARVAAEIPHPLEGFKQCESCHGLKADIPYPIRHLGWSIESCTRCHAPSDHAAAERTDEYGRPRVAHGGARMAKRE
jgi:hypothetical protein